MKQTTFRIPDKLYQRLKKEAREKGISMNAYVINMFWKMMKE